jgi:DNA-binding transcriptional ArsR family regulator
MTSLDEQAADRVPGVADVLADGGADAGDDARTQAQARALSSPLRLRILRLCAFDARTNKELAELLVMNPGTMLHHVRTLVSTGFLAADPERTGAQGAREVPYRATGRSWGTPVPGQSTVLVETMRQQLVGVDPETVQMTWLGLRLNAEHQDELSNRLYELVVEFKERGPDPDGDAYSLVTVLHPDLNPRAGGAPG